MQLFLFPPRVQKECLAFSPLLPSDISELCIRGVNYLGCRMDWLLRKDDVSVILRQQAGSVDSNAKSCDLQVVLKDSGIQIPLVPGNKRQQLHLRGFFSCSIVLDYSRGIISDFPNAIMSFNFLIPHPALCKCIFFPSNS